MLINNQQELKEILGGAINKNLSWASIGNFIGQAETKHIIPVIGRELYNELDTTPAADRTPEQKVALGLLGQSLAYYGLLEALPFLNTQIGDGGIQESSSPARQWVFHEMQETASSNADTFLDQALSFFEFNAAKFNSWTNSDAFTISKELFISSTEELSRYINIQRSRRTFLAFRPFLLRAQDIYIVPALGEELAAELEAARKSGLALPADLQKLLKVVQPALAHFALLEAAPELAIAITSGGFKVLSENEGIRQRLGASGSQLSALRNNSERLGGIYMTNLKSYLDSIIQVGETDPADKQQSFTAPDNSGSASFWV